MTLHWIRQQTLTDWLQAHRAILADADALLLTDDAAAQLPPTSPCTQTLYALATEATSPMPDYVTLIDDAQWLALVLEYDHQITW